MRRLLGNPKPKVPGVTLDQAAQRMDDRVVAYDQKIAACDQQLLAIKEKMKTARGSASTSLKQQALRVLKQKKMYEQQRDAMSGQSFNVQQASFATQGMKDAQVTVDAMRLGVTEMKAAYKKVKVSDVDALQDEMEDMMEMTGEIQEALGRSYGVGEVDEADLEDELASLGDELTADSTPSYLTALQSQPVPTSDPSAAPGSRVAAPPSTI